MTLPDCNLLKRKYLATPYLHPRAQPVKTPRHGTSHIVTADASGMAISLTTTVNLLFGSQLVVPETGVIMNNEMNDFSIPGQSNAFGYEPSPANFIKPGKRPLSSISPTIVEYLNNGTLYFVIGSAGGSRIITATVQNLWHVLDQNETVKESLAEPRLHDQVRIRLSPFPFIFRKQMRSLLVVFMTKLRVSRSCSRTPPNSNTPTTMKPRRS